MNAREQFPTTRWSVVLSARSSNQLAHEALADLCSGYWYPIYSFTRRRGYPAEEAKDLTQGFFLSLLEKGILDRVRRGEGRFRSFLLTSLQRHISHEHERARAIKRGGGAAVLSLDTDRAERRYRRGPRDERTPEKLFERSWAQTVLDRAEQRLGEEFEAAGKAESFSRLSAYLGATGRAKPYRAVAEELGTSEDAIKMAVRRMRRRFGRLLRDEVAQTVQRPEEVDDELRYLLGVLGDS